MQAVYTVYCHRCVILSFSLKKWICQVSLCIEKNKQNLYQQVVRRFKIFYICLNMYGVLVSHIQNFNFLTASFCIIQQNYLKFHYEFILKLILILQLYA